MQFTKIYRKHPPHISAQVIPKKFKKRPAIIKRPCKTIQKLNLGWSGNNMHIRRKRKTIAITFRESYNKNGARN